MKSISANLGCKVLKFDVFKNSEFSFQKIVILLQAKIYKLIKIQSCTFSRKMALFDVFRFSKIKFRLNLGNRKFSKFPHYAVLPIFSFHRFTQTLQSKPSRLPEHQYGHGQNPKRDSKNVCKIARIRKCFFLFFKN